VVGRTTVTWELGKWAWRCECEHVKVNFNTNISYCKTVWKYKSVCANLGITVPEAQSEGEADLVFLSPPSQSRPTDGSTRGLLGCSPLRCLRPLSSPRHVLSTTCHSPSPTTLNSTATQTLPSPLPLRVQPYWRSTTTFSPVTPTCRSSSATLPTQHWH
jgi:hypothetical protein